MTKANFTKKMENMNVKYNTDTKSYEMTENKFNDLMSRDEMVDCIVKQKPNNPNYKMLKNAENVTIGYITIKTRKPKTEKPENVSRETKSENITGGKGFKPRNVGYVVKYKNTGEKSEKTNKDFKTRNELVEWLKTLSKKNMDYLRIYDELGNECRKSAWYEKPVKNETKTA